MPGEFDIIRNWFTRAQEGDGLVRGIGDDGAVLRPRAGFDLVVVTDTLVAGRHFPEDFSADDIGWRALAVNLSDIAAMGATPRFAFLDLTLERADPAWLDGFAGGFFALADAQGVRLAGGDTTQGPLSVTVTVIGELPQGSALTRAGAQPGDLVCVSGTPGEAAAGLERWQRGEREGALVERFRRPAPRLALGERLRGRATAAIDVSDGLAADLAHMLDASGVGARIAVSSLPVSAALQAHAAQGGAAAADYVLAGGDDYELCFCLPRERLREAAVEDIELAVIGEVRREPGLELVGADGAPYRSARRGWQHFRPEAGA